MQNELVTVTTADGVELDGALYRPVTPGTSRASSILMVHGLTWNFYRGPSRWLPPLLAAAGYPCLSLNMRDHDLAEPKEFELAHHDLNGGVEYLAAQNGGEIVLLAHGFACNKVARYAAASNDGIPRRTILTTLGAAKAYRPEIWAAALSAAAAMRGDTLIVQGAIDTLIEARARADELTQAATAAQVETVLLEGADHYFNQRHEALASVIAEWLGRTGDAR
jgi:pimeloyl-ACP methyl ester carboxylesterase